MSLQPATLSQVMPDQLAGIDADRIVHWTLRDSILSALENNLVEIRCRYVQLAQFDIPEAQGVYDPLTSSALSYNSQKTPNHRGHQSVESR